MLTQNDPFPLQVKIGEDGLPVQTRGIAAPALVTEDIGANINTQLQDLEDLKAAHAHVGSKIAKGIVAEIEANQSKNSLRIEQASLNTSSISIDSEGNNLHILLSEAGRRQIKLHL